LWKAIIIFIIIIIYYYYFDLVIQFQEAREPGLRDLRFFQKRDSGEANFVLVMKNRDCFM